MPSTSQLFDLKQKHLVGKLVYTDRGNARITNIAMPPAPNIMVIGAADMKVPNINIYDESFPVFADGFSSYPGQPLLAVFGPDTESIDLFAAAVQVSYTAPETDKGPEPSRNAVESSDPSADIAEASENAAEQDSNTDTGPGTPEGTVKAEEAAPAGTDGAAQNASLSAAQGSAVSNQPEVVKTESWSKGSPASFFLSKNTIFTSKFKVYGHGAASLRTQRISAHFEDNFIHLRIATQWPLHVRDSVAEVLGLSKKQVRIYPQSYYAPYDQMALKPSVGAVITAVAAAKAGGLVELNIPMTSFQPELDFEISTVLDHEGHPLAQRADVTADLGAFPIFEAEYCRSLLAGLVPVYSLYAAEINIKILRSPTPPASLFGDLGCSMALAAVENHYNKLANSIGRLPSEWKAANIGKTEIQNELVQSSQMDKLPVAVNQCVQACRFDRHYAANSQTGLARNGINPFISYSRGIGVACGQGIQGFSYKFRHLNKYSLSVTLTPDGKAIINSGMIAWTETRNIWSDLVRRRLGVPHENIIYEDINSENVTDLGPSVLSRAIRFVPALLEDACAQIKQQLGSSSLPADAPLTAVALSSPESMTCLFNADTSGTMAVSLHIDPVMLIPVVDHVWIRIQMGRAYDISRLENKARQTVAMVISEMCPCAVSSYNMDFKAEPDKSKPAGSISSLIRALTAAALTSALSQALGHTVNKVPVTDKDMLAIVRKGAAKAASKHRTDSTEVSNEN